MPFLKPLTASPRSPPMFFNFFRAKNQNNNKQNDTNLYGANTHVNLLVNLIYICGYYNFFKALVKTNMPKAHIENKNNLTKKDMKHFKKRTIISHQSRKTQLKTTATGFRKNTVGLVPPNKKLNHYQSSWSLPVFSVIPCFPVIAAKAVT